MQPTISICIPTFNRSICLENLLKNILIIKTAHGTDIEICISNNQSTDTTQQVIEAWRQKLMLKTVTQPTNIGASKNVIEVTRLATGKWILLIGDDDEFIATGIESLLAFIHTADENDWILAGVANESGNEHLLGDLKHGLYEAKSLEEFYCELASIGLDLSGCIFFRRHCANNSLLFRFRRHNHGHTLRFSCGASKEDVFECFLIRLSSNVEVATNYIGTLVTGFGLILGK